MSTASTSEKGYENALKEAREAWNTYRNTLHKYGAVEHISDKGMQQRVPVELTKNAKINFKNKFLNLVYEYALKYGKPVSPMKIVKEVSEKDANKIRCMYDNIGINFPYDILHKSGVWGLFNGEPLHSIIPHKHKIYSSDRFPSVYFSYSGGKNDIIYIPRLREPDEKVAELATIILSIGTPEVKYKSGLKNIIDTIIIGRKDVIYLKKHVIPLISDVFQLTNNFCPKNLQITSVMIGSYFQNVVGIFDVDFDGKAIRQTPKTEFNEKMKKASIRAVLDCKGTLYPGHIAIKTSWKKTDILLEPIREYLLEFGIDTSEIVPMFGKQQKLEILTMNNEKALCRIFTKVPPPLGSIIYEKLGNKLKEIGTIVKNERGSWKIPVQVEVNLTRKPEGELYVECEYTIWIKGGKKTIENLIQSIIPKNPLKLLHYLRRKGEIPSLQVNKQDLEEFIYDNWNGNLEELKESLHKEFIY